LTPGRFSRFAVIDWSGAKGSRHKGIALAVCSVGKEAPVLIDPPSPAWSRTAILEWILAQSDDLLIGFDFSFAPPYIARGAYLPGDDTADAAKPFWRYVDACCDDDDLGSASFLETRHRRHFYFGSADGTKSDYMHLRKCEAHYNAQGGGKPSTVFDVIGAAQVAKASFAGMRLLNRLAPTHPVWPFDDCPQAGPCVIEIYTQIAARASGLRKGLSKVRDGQSLDQSLSAFGSAPHIPLKAYTDHATDAILTAAWLRKHADQTALWHPSPLTREIAQTEGWTFGVV
jgi:hypothetical protein